MSDIPQPAAEPFEPGDKVRIYVDPEDQDVQYHNTICTVVDVIEDDLDKSARELDRFSYGVKSVETGEVLPVTFRHADLVAVE